MNNTNLNLKHDLNNAQSHNTEFNHTPTPLSPTSKKFGGRKLARSSVAVFLLRLRKVKGDQAGVRIDMKHANQANDNAASSSLSKRKIIAALAAITLGASVLFMSASLNATITPDNILQADNAALIAAMEADPQNLAAALNAITVGE